MMDRWRILTAAPHRMFFAAGLLWLLVWSAWWTLLLAARAAGIAGLEPVTPALLVHGASVLYLAFVPFMYGFLCTVFPRWMPAPQPERGTLILAFGLFNGGSFLLVISFVAPMAWFVAGWMAASAAHAVIFAELLRIFLRTESSVPHALTVLGGLAAGLAGMLLFAQALWDGDLGAWPMVRGLGFWGLLVVVYFSVCHRMIPFFSSRVVTEYKSWRPDWILYLFVILALARAVLETVPRLAWLTTGPMACIALLCSVRWWPRSRTDARLLDVLHISFAWLSFGLVLAAAGDLAAALGAPGLLGRAPLHAIGLGFFGGMLIAMVTRVTLGHSGRQLVLDTATWHLFLAVQVAASLRVVAEFLPGTAAWLSVLAALVWLAALLRWAAMYLPVYFQPRVDGAPG